MAKLFSPCSSSQICTSSPEGDKVKLFELVYFQKHAPKEVLEHWNILVGRQPAQNIGLRTEDGWDISGEDVQIWLEEQGENKMCIRDRPITPVRN